MADLRITDLVDESAIQQLRETSEELQRLKGTFIDVAREVSKGLNMKIDNIEELRKMEERIAEQTKKIAYAQDRLNSVLGKQKESAEATAASIGKQMQAEKEAARVATLSAEDLVKSYRNVQETVEKQIGSRKENIETLTAEQTKLNLLKQEQADWNKRLKEGRTNLDKYNEVMAKLNREGRKYQATIKQLNTVLNNQDKEAATVSGSFEQLRQQLELMKKAYKSMSDEEKESLKGKELVTTIQHFDKALKDSSATMGEYQMNVGHYEKSTVSLKSELRDLTQEAALLLVQFRQMSEEERNSTVGKELQERLYQVTQEAAQLKDAIGDVNQEISNVSSDTTHFDSMAGGLKLLADGFTIAEGGAHLLGLREEDLVAVQTKLQAAFTVSNALTEIQNSLQKQSAVMLGVERVQRLAAAQAVNIKTAAEGKGIIATKAATVAQAAFNKVANANPYVLLAGAILSVVGALALFTMGTKEATEKEKQEAEALAEARREHERLTDTTRALSDARREGGVSVNSEITKLNLLYKAATNTSKQMGERIAAVKELKKLYPDYLKDLSDEAIMAGDAAKAYDKLTDSLIETAIARSKQKKLEEIAEKYTEVMAEIEEKSKNFNPNWMEEVNKAGQTAAWRDRPQEDIIDANPFLAQQRNVAEELEQLKTQAEEYQAAMKNIAETIDVSKIVSKERQTGASPSTSTSENEKTTTKNMVEVETIILESTRKTIQERLSIEKEGSESERILKKQLAEVDEQITIRSAKKTYAKQREELEGSLNAQKISREEYTKAVVALDEQLEQSFITASVTRKKAEEKADEEMAESKINTISEQYATMQAIRDESFTMEMAELEKRQAEELATAEGNISEISEIRERYAKETAEKMQEYERETAEAAIDSLREQLESAGLTAEQRVELNRRLAEAQIDLEKLMADHAVETMNAEIDADKRKHDTMMSNLGKWADKTREVLNAVNELLGSIFEAQIKRIEEEEETVNEKREKDFESIEMMEESKVITKEEAEARKRAAEEVSERKHEELEKKKAAIEYKKAVTEKANKIAQIAISTALAITQALPNIPLSIVVGGIGAVQLATAIAQPIKAYAKGTDEGGHPGGLALVGDAGRSEIVLFDGKAWLTPDKPTLVDLPMGTEVIPDADSYLKELTNSFRFLMPDVLSSDKPLVEVKVDGGTDKENLKATQQTNNILKRMMKQQHYDAYLARFNERVKNL